MVCYCERAGVSDVSYSDQQLPFGSEDDIWVIFGSRSFAATDGSTREQAERVLDEFDDRDLEYPDAIVSGGADGADAVAEAVALHLDVPMVVFTVNGPSDGTAFRRDLADAPWVVDTVTDYDGEQDDPTSGKGAYLTRNCMMAELVGQHGGYGFAIWDGDSNGTAHMIDSCHSHGVEPVIWEFST
jgi:hypothetical protein